MADLSARDAMALIERTSGFEEPIRRRTESLTWILWGLILAASVLAMEVVAAHWDWYEAGGWRRLFVSLFWVPGVMVGIGATRILWGIAQLTARDATLKRSARANLVWIAALAAIWILFMALQEGFSPWFPLLLVGSCWLLAGIMDLYRATPSGRLALLAIGAVTAGAALALLAMAPTHEAWDLSPVVTPALLGGVPILGGFAQRLWG